MLSGSSVYETSPYHSLIYVRENKPSDVPLISGSIPSMAGQNEATAAERNSHNEQQW